MARNIAVQVNEKRFDDVFEKYCASDRPGAAVGVAVEGRPVYRRGVGRATMELPVTLSPSTRMRIYSITKHFTCLAYLLLCEEGRADLDDPIRKYLPSLDRTTGQVTVRQLMSNTSGLWDVSDIRWCLGGGGGVFPLAEVRGVYQRLGGCNFSPGDAWCYNNGGFQLLSEVIQEISGCTLAEFFRARIFEPAGMYDTLLRPLDSDFVENSAMMHMTDGRGRYERTYLPGELSGEGGIVSTVDDMLRWLRQMERPTVGTPGSWSLLKTPVALSNGVSSGYGLGLFAKSYRGARLIEHSGGGLGASAQMINVPDVRLDVVVLTNAEDVKAPKLAYQILDECLSGLDGVPWRDERRVIEGVYRSSSSGRVVRLYGEEGQQRVSLNWGGGYVFHWGRDGTLSGDPMSSLHACTIRMGGGGGESEEIEFENHQRIERLTAVRVPNKVEPSSIAGTYRSEGVGTIIRIRAEQGSVRLDTTGCFGAATYSLRCLSENLWAFEPVSRPLPWRGLLLFDSAKGSFLWMTERTWSLKFSKESTTNWGDSGSSAGKSG